MCMKKLIMILMLFGLVLNTATAQKKSADKSKSSGAASSTEKKAIDFKVKPPVGELREVEFPHYEQATLKNGLKVYVIEDRRQPTILYRLQVGAGESMDGDKNGLSFMMTNLIYKGTQKRSAEAIANQLDSVGASLSTNTAGELMTASMEGLKKHNALMLNIFSDVIQHPLFSKEEFEKMLPQVMASIKQEKSNPGQLGAALARMVIYGKDHPSAARKTEASVKKITIEDVRAFHERWVRPNNRATLAIVGDVSLKEILPQLEKAFGSWQPSAMTMSQIPQPKSMPKGVYFIQRPGSVQSSVMVAALMPARKDEAYEPMMLTTSVLGSGFAGRLFKTLRETYSFTYTPYAHMTQGKYFNRFGAGADVRNAVTDSTIIVLKNEIEKIVKEPAGDDEFNTIKTNEVGNYLMSFEHSDFTAVMLQNADYLGLSPEYLKGYSKRLSAYTPFDAQRAAQGLLRSDKLYLIVVGSPEIAPVLAKYGRVFSYNLDLEPVADNLEKVSMSVDDLMKKVQGAVGGADKMNAIQTMKVSSKLSINAGGKTFDGSGERKHKAPNKKLTKLQTPFGGQVYYVNGTNAWVSMMGQPADEMDEKTKKSALAEASLFYYAHLPELGYKCEISGKQNGQILVKATTPAGESCEFYFDGQTYLLSRIDQIQDSPSGPVTISEFYTNYKEVNGVKLPTHEKLEVPGMSFEGEVSYEANVPVDDKEFEPSK